MSIQQRSLLARIEGQLARLIRIAGASDSLDLPEAAALHWQRIEWAAKALHPLLAAPDGLVRFKRLLTELRALRSVAIGRSEFLHRATLLRADCVIWQLSFVQGRRQRDIISRAGVLLASEPRVNETAR